MQIEFEGRRYRCISGKWVDGRNFVVSENIQSKLNKLYAESLKLDELNLKELIQVADGFKDSASFLLAIRYYEEAVFRGDIKQIVYILPRITSCYRKCGMPQKAIDLFSSVKKEHGINIFSSALLTSVGAAYCDLGKYTEAKKCADRAFAIAGGKADENLSNLYGRIKKETQ